MDAFQGIEDGEVGGGLGRRRERAVEINDILALDNVELDVRPAIGDALNDRPQERLGEAGPEREVGVGNIVIEAAAVGGEDVAPAVGGDDGDIEGVLPDECPQRRLDRVHLVPHGRGLGQHCHARNDVLHLDGGVLGEPRRLRGVRPPVARADAEPVPPALQVHHHHRDREVADPAHRARGDLADARRRRRHHRVEEDHRIVDRDQAARLERPELDLGRAERLAEPHKAAAVVVLLGADGGERRGARPGRLCCRDGDDERPALDGVGNDLERVGAREGEHTAGLERLAEDKFPVVRPDEPLCLDDAIADEGLLRLCVLVVRPGELLELVLVHDPHVGIEVNRGVRLCRPAVVRVRDRLWHAFHDVEANLALADLGRPGDDDVRVRADAVVHHLVRPAEEQQPELALAWEKSACAAHAGDERPHEVAKGGQAVVLLAPEHRPRQTERLVGGVRRAHRQDARP